MRTNLFPRIKRMLPILLVICLILTMIPITALAQHTDIQDHWAEKILTKWSELGWFLGYDEGSYCPDEYITRAEFMALINRMKNYQGRSPNIVTYRDVPVDSWYYETVSAALEAGYIVGTSDTTMSPEEFITRQEAMTIIARIEEVSSDGLILAQAIDGKNVADWAKDPVGACIENGLVVGDDGKLNPLVNITRAESVVLMDRVYSDIRTYCFPGTYGPEIGSMQVWEANITGSGVVLQNIEVTGDLIIAASVGDGNVTLNNVNVKNNLYARGGGIDTLYFNSVTVGNSLVVRKRDGNIRILATGKSAAKVVVLESGAIIVTKGISGGAFETVEIPESFIEGHTIVLDGNFDKVQNRAKDVKLQANGRIGILDTDQNLDIIGAADIDKIDVSGKATVTVNDDKQGTTPTPAGSSSSSGSSGSSSGSGSDSGGGTEIAVSGVTISQSTGELYVNDTLILTATVIPSNAGNKSVNWSTDNADVAIVTNGIVIGVGEGSATITVTTADGNFTDSCVVTVISLVVPKILTDIILVAHPVKLLYSDQDTELDFTGIKVKATYDDGTEEVIPVNKLDFSGFEPDFEEPVAITVTYAENGIIKTVQFMVDFINVTLPDEDKSYTLKSITNPKTVKLENDVTEDEILTALPPQIEIIYTDDADEAKPKFELKFLAEVIWTVADFDAEMEGEQNITATGEITLPEEIDDGGLTLTVLTNVIISAVEYIVAFDLNGAPGIAPEAQMVEYNGIAISPESAPARENYTFLGWYDGEDEFNFETKITGNLTLKAKWQIIKYKVVFISNDPDREVSSIVNSGETVTAPDDFEKEGFILEGWYIDENLKKKYNFDIPVTDNFTLYAKWTEDSELANAKDALTFADIKGKNDIDTAVSKDLNLVNKLVDYPNVNITWLSGDPDVISNTGKVTQPEENDVTVTLTATLTKGTENDSKEITVIVLKQGIEAEYGDYIDNLFAPGYPKSVINKNGTIDLVVKLIEPAELFVIFEVDNHQESIPIGVIRGHEGDYPFSRDSYYLNITNTEEQTIKTNTHIGDSLGTIIDFALRQGGKISEEVTSIKYDVKTLIELDVQAPAVSLAAVNQDSDRIYLYFTELMDKTLTLKAEDFILSSGNVTAIGEFTELEDSFFKGTYLELKVSGFELSEGDKDTLIYKGEDLRDLSGNKWNGKIHNYLMFKQPSNTITDVMVSSDKKKIRFTVDGLGYAPNIENLRLDNKILVLKDNQPISVVHGGWISHIYSSEYDIELNEPIEKDNFIIKITDIVISCAFDEIPANTLEYTGKKGDNTTYLEPLAFEGKGIYSDGVIVVETVSGILDNGYSGAYFTVDIEDISYQLQAGNTETMGYLDYEGVLAFGTGMNRNQEDYCYYSQVIKPAIEAAFDEGKTVILTYDTNAYSDFNHSKIQDISGEIYEGQSSWEIKQSFE